jgi:hypothetical protein
MAKGEVLGFIDCPHCGLKDGMRITEDKNGEPFGFCEAECDGQLRVGGKARRVEKFYTKHPHLRRKTGEPPTVKATGGAVPVVSAKPAGTTETTPKPIPKAPRVGLLIEG